MPDILKKFREIAPGSKYNESDNYSYDYNYIMFRQVNYTIKLHIIILLVF